MAKDDKPALPALARQKGSRVDGAFFEEFQFGTPGDEHHYRDTLGDEWKASSEQERSAEMEARWHNWVTLKALAAQPAGPADLAAQLRDAQQACRDAQRRVLDLEDQIAAQVEVIAAEG